MVAVTLILDGASEPLGPAPTSLERARTPVLNSLARAAALSRVRTVPLGLSAGSEHAIPTLLGWPPAASVDRGMVEAAAQELQLAEEEWAWRVDVREGDERADEPTVERVAAELAASFPGHLLRRLAEHRLLLSGPRPLLLRARDDLWVWPEGAVPPRVLGPETVVVAARGAAAGIARLMGATVVVPEGATGSLDTNLRSKAEAARRALADGAEKVVVHVGAPDEAAHHRDPVAKIRALEDIDCQLLAPLAEGVRAHGGTLTICPDHGCDPHTGLHDDLPVPCLVWRAEARRPAGSRRLTERAVAALELVDLTRAQELVA